MGSVVRAARLSDAAAIAAVHAPASAALIQEHPGLVHVGEAAGSVVGYVALKQAAHPAVAARNPVQLWQIYVLAAFHGTGIAAKLMATALGIARSHSHDVIWLGVSEHNARAIAFYRKHGFEPLGLHAVGAGHDEHQDLLMSCRVS